MARHTLGQRRNRKEDERRDRLRRAAIEVFSTKGYQQATVDDLAREAGVSKSLLYWYWEGKADLLTELIDLCMAPYKPLLREALEGDQPFGDRFHQLLWDYVTLYREQDRLNKLVHFCSLHSGKEGDPDFGAQVSAHYREIVALLDQLFHQGQAEGYFRSDLDASAAATGLLALVEGHIYLSILEERMPLERLLLPMLTAVRSNGGAETEP